MSKLRSVSTAFWSDPWIETLTPNQKLLFLYLITNEKTNMLGIYEASIKKISFETGIPEATVSKDLKAFESLGKVKYSKTFVILTNFIKHQNYNPNMKKAAISIYNDLPQDIKIEGLTLDESNPLKAFESLCKGLGMVRKVEVEEEEEREDEEEPKKPKKKGFIPPSKSEVIEYFKENGYREDVASKVFEYYNVADWHDSKGDAVKNWKQKMQSVWFKDENKIAVLTNKPYNPNGQSEVIKASLPYRRPQE
jgi:hypothetical protein